MKILVLSDSHFSLRFMRECMDAIHPDEVIHLGDCYEDGDNLRAEYPGVPFHQVTGNCDLFRCPPGLPSKLCYDVGGVRMLMVHGHEQGVKSGTHRLASEARVNGAKAALYGHTHVPDCHQEEDGIWVLNPGSSRYTATAGLIETENNQIVTCRIITQENLEKKV